MTCFICMEEGARKTSCRCTDLYAHDECLIRAIQSSNRATCSVCLSSYSNAKITERQVRQVTRFAIYVGVIYLLIGLIFAAAIYLHIKASVWIAEAFSRFFYVCSFTSFTAISLKIIVMAIRGQMSCIAYKKITSVQIE